MQAGLTKKRLATHQGFEIGGNIPFQARRRVSPGGLKFFWKSVIDHTSLASIRADVPRSLGRTQSKSGTWGFRASLSPFQILRQRRERRNRPTSNDSANPGT
jgi:hypothetical protein